MSFPAQNNRRENNNNGYRRPRANAVQAARSEWVPRGSVANDATNTGAVVGGSSVGLEGSYSGGPVQQVNSNRNFYGSSSWNGNQRQENGGSEQQVYKNRIHRGGSSANGNQRQGNGRLEQQVYKNRRFGGFQGQGASHQYVNQRREKEKYMEKGRGKGNDGGDTVTKVKDENLPPLVQEIQEKLMTSSIECMICYDMVRRSAPVWSCSSCFSIFHLSCIKKWARAPTSVDMSAEKNQGFNWRCPGCQSVQLTSSNEIRYLCFCGKRPDPSFDLYLTPHSCGEPCGKPLEKVLLQPGMNNEDLCPHVCVLQCHPGPCPPCKAFAPPKMCPCGKKIINTRCSDRKLLLTCGGQCGKLLDCGRHRCQDTCHSGPCVSCQVSVNASCFCNKKTEVILCGDMAVKGEVCIEAGVFSCNSICEKVLDCENHKCPDTCHPGPCGECGLLPSKITTCCCGKTSLKEVRQSCLDPIPTCSEICNKTLPCKLHNCREVCHSGDCAPCHVSVTQKCLCGSTSRTVECFRTVAENEKFTCDRPCGQKKSCGRHRCSERCCPLSNPRNISSGDSDPHFCSIPCGKKLRCGLHSCELFCHSGHCPPCLETIFTDLTCACGRTSIPPPLPCGTPPPSCQLPCSFPQPCGHLPSHSCHFGDCSPCTVPIAKECIGGHVVLRNIPCGSKDIKCNKLCGKLRQCGLHACARICHPAPCDSSVGSSSEGRASCGQICGAPRRECRHTCAALCHSGVPCPAARCEFPVTITCSCGRITASVPCDAGGSSGVHSGDTLFEASVIQKLPVALQPVEANGKKVPLGQRKLMCDDVCANVERKKALADAFGISTPNLAELHFGENAAVSEVLSDLLRRDPKWVLSVEERCKFLVFSRARGGVNALKSHVFCPMSKEKRDAVRFVAERWKLSVNAAGWEPKRFVILHVTQKSKPPARVLGVKGSSSSTMVQPPMFDPLVDMDPRLVVALFDLPRDANISALVLRFGGECELVWLNDKNALTVFSDPARAATAMRRLDQGSVYYGAAALPNKTGLVSSSGGGNPWGASGVVKDGSAVEAPKGNPWKKGVSSEAEWGGDSPWSATEWIGNEDVEPSVWKGTEVPVTSANQWNVLDRETASSSTTASEKSDYLEKPLGVPLVGSEQGSSGPSLLTDVKIDENPEVADDWEKACD